MRGVVGEQAEEHLPEDLHLTLPAMAGVHLHRAVRGRVGPRGAVLPDVLLQPTEHGVGRHLAGVVAALAGREPQLELPRVARTRPQQRVDGQVSRRVVASCGGRGAAVSDALPQRPRRVRQPQVHVAVRGQGFEDRELLGGHPGRAEHRQPGREVHVIRR